MPDESYISTLDSMIASKEAVIERLDRTIAEKTKKMNGIKDEVHASEKGFATTLKEQREIANEEVGQVRAQVESFKESTGLNLDDLVKKDKDLKERELLLEEEGRKMKTLRQRLEDEKRATEALIEESMELMQKATFIEKTAKLTDEQATARLLQARKTSEVLSSKIKEWMTFEKERSKLLDDRQKRLDLELKMARVEREGYLKIREEILEEKRAIKSQWQQILSAKSYLDGERSKPCPTCTLRK